MRESKIEAALVLGIEALGGTAEKFVTPGRRFVPDRLVCWPAKIKTFATASIRMQPLAEFVETKALYGKLHPGQERDHARRRALGFQVYVIWTMEDVEAYLRARGKR